MVVDNLRNVEMVLASGEIVQANQTENPDLFWAVRGISIVVDTPLIDAGGGVNFGIVIEFSYQAYPQAQNVYSGWVIFKPTDLEALVAAFNHWFASEDAKNPKTALLLITCAPPPSFTPTFVAVPFFNGDETEGRRIFKPFFDIMIFVYRDGIVIQLLFILMMDLNSLKIQMEESHS